MSPRAKQKTPFALAPALLLPLLLNACAAQPAAPTWLDHPASRAPLGWWAAVGFGDTPAAAHDDAMLRLAQRLEARVVAEERLIDAHNEARFDRAAVVRTDVVLAGAEQLALHHGTTTAVLLGFDPAGAARTIATRAEAALADHPPRVAHTLLNDIERGAVLDPDAADWRALRAQVSARLTAAPARLDAPDPVAQALRESFGDAVANAAWSERAMHTHRPGQRLRAWTLTADVDGVPRRWSGVVSDADPAEAAAAKLRAATILK